MNQSDLIEEVSWLNAPVNAGVCCHLPGLLKPRHQGANASTQQSWSTCKVPMIRAACKRVNSKIMHLQGPDDQASVKTRQLDNHEAPVRSRWPGQHANASTRQSWSTCKVSDDQASVQTRHLNNHEAPGRSRWPGQHANASTQQSCTCKVPMTRPVCKRIISTINSCKVPMNRPVCKRVK